MSKRTVKDNAQSAAYLTGAGALGTRGVQNLLPRKDLVQITYGYKKGTGIGHKSLAEEYKKLLASRGIDSKLYNTAQPKDWVTNFLDAPKQTARIDTVFGIPSLLKPQTIKGNVDNYNPKNKNPFPFASGTSDITYTPGALSKELGLGGKKVVSIAAGESGLLLEDKVRATQKALKGRKDVHYLVLGGSRGDEVAKIFKNQANVSVKGFLPKKDFQRYLAQSDLNIGYSGSSSIAEQLSSRNPAVNFFTVKNKRNLEIARQNFEWADKNWNLPGFTSDNFKDYKKTVNQLLDSPNLGEIGSRRSAYLGAVKQQQEEVFRNLAKTTKQTKINKAILGSSMLLGATGLAYKAFRKKEAK